MATGKTPEHRYLIIIAVSAAVVLLGCIGLSACWVLVPEPATPAPRPTWSWSPAPILGYSPSPSPSSSPSVDLSPSPEAEEPYYETCKDAVKADVPLPIRSNEPGYGIWLDGDKDGKACE